MVDKEQALHNFWSSFDLMAYDENSIPDDAVMPYITYSVSTDSIGYAVPISASVWYRSTSWTEVTEKAHEISEYIGIGGKVIKLDSGYAYLFRGSPFAQRIPDGNDQMVKRIYFNVNCEFLTDK